MPTNADYMNIVNGLRSTEAPFGAGALPADEAAVVPRGSPADVQWQAYHPNLLLSGTDGKLVTFRRTKQSDFDVALGQAISSGRFEWTVVAPNDGANNYCGVARASCDKRIYPTATSAWTMYLHDAELLSGEVTKANTGAGFTRLDGTRGLMSELVGGARNQGNKGCQKHPGWVKRVMKPIERGTPITCILDMDERTLAFAIGDAEPKLAYTDLPETVHPYVCSGNHEDRSALEIFGGAHTVVANES